jgi:uncharacterized membrane protein YccC
VGGPIVAVELLRGGDISTIRSMQSQQGEPRAVGSKDHRKSSKSDRFAVSSVLGDIRRSMRELLGVCLQVERAHIAYACGIRTALTLMAVLWVARSFGGMEFAMPMAVGILMVNLADVCEPHGFRWRTMLWATACASLSTWLAGMVSSEPAAHLIAGILLAALLGYVAALGTKSSLIGSIGLCMFSLYAGSEIGSHRALVDALGVGAGGALATLVAIASWPLRRLEAPRVQIAIAYEKFACACADVQTRWSSTNVASAILDAAKTVETSGATGATEVWLRKFLEDLEHCRRVLLAIGPVRERLTNPASLDRVMAAACKLARALAAGLALKNRAPRVRAELERFQAACEAHDDPASAELVRHMRDRLTDAAQLIAGRWPIGRAAAMRTVKSQFPDIRQLIRQHTHMSDPCVRHAMKLSITYGLAVAISLGPWDPSHIHHTYWIPLTVAWICKPDLSSTMGRIGMRVLGTAAGVLLVTVLLNHIGSHRGIILIAAMGGFLSCGFLWANYAVMVIGMTLAVLSLGALAGVAVEAEAFVRLLATLLAGALVALTALVYPLRKSAAFSIHFTSICADLRKYAEGLRQGEPEAELSKARAALLRDRTNAALTLAAAAAEPPALWERGRIRVDVAGAKAVLHDLEVELSKLIAIDLLGHQLRDSPTAWPQFETTLCDIERRIGGLCGTKASES